MDMEIRNRREQNQGMNWIRPEKRLAIYLRDGMACCWCGASIENDGVKLTLDHLMPYSKGGTHGHTNLVTCCGRCNSSRGNRPMAAFARVVAEYLGLADGNEILAHISRTRGRKLNVPAAKELISRRGGFVAACKPEPTLK